ncbi:Putative Transthyretin domain protein [Aspergillus calidoustus]|uniref:hydroxyisourate hydrolase n=1 Tax=Aspergillus calidoustus TaxID=454130 RepID=A0A0U5G6D7_ASPCI|nr:Putative Transthyretin domain protein [Aspergillus calidoustus]
MDIGSSSNPPSSDQLGKVTTRLNLYKNHLTSSSPPSSTTFTPKVPSNTPTMAARDPITCHVLNTLTGTPAANLPVTLTLLSSTNTTTTTTFNATTNADGRVANWTPTPETASASSSSVPAILASLPAADSKTNWALRFEVGPWFEAQGVESFWPEVEVKFTVKGRGKEGEEGWRHYHVPVLLGPWNYSTYRGS